MLQIQLRVNDRNDLSVAEASGLALELHCIADVLLRSGLRHRMNLVAPRNAAHRRERLCIIQQIFRELAGKCICQHVVAIADLQFRIPFRQLRDDRILFRRYDCALCGSLRRHELLRCQPGQKRIRIQRDNDVDRGAALCCRRDDLRRRRCVLQGGSGRDSVSGKTAANEQKRSLHADDSFV